MELIRSTTNSKIKAVCALKDSKARRERNLFVAEGLRIVKDSTFLPRELYVTEKFVEFAQNYQKICSVYIVTEEVFLKMSDTKSPQGVLGVYDVPNTKVDSPKGDYAIVLDGVKDPGNVGTIIRTAPACGFKDIYLIESADPFSPKVVRSSMGGVFRTNIFIGEREEIISALREKDTNIYALDMGGESVFDANISLPVALVVGSEAQGVSNQMRDSSNKILALPMKDDTESLNAGVSAGISMYLIGFKK